MSSLNLTDPKEVIRQLDLAPHPTEGGYFRRTYASELVLNPNTDAQRPTMSSIYYLLTTDSPQGKWHKNKSDILHYFHGGGAIEYRIIAPNGQHAVYTLGGDLDQQQVLQLLVPGGYWKHAQLVSGRFGLLSEAVSPGFDFKDNEIASDETIKAFEQKFQSLV